MQNTNWPSRSRAANTGAQLEVAYSSLKWLLLGSLINFTKNISACTSAEGLYIDTRGYKRHPVPSKTPSLTEDFCLYFWPEDLVIHSWQQSSTLLGPDSSFSLSAVLFFWMLCCQLMLYRPDPQTKMILIQTLWPITQFPAGWNQKQNE